MKTLTRKQVIGGALWLLVFAGTAYMAVRRYQEFINVVPNGPVGISGDFWTFLHASRAMSAGRSPYSFSELAQGAGYVYSAFIALLLLPFCHAGNQHIWRIWTVLSIVAVVVFGVLVMMAESCALGTWRRPLLAGFIMITALEFMPTTVEFTSGQTDSFVLMALAAAVLASDRGRAATSGAFIGVAALIKTWPLGAAISLCRRGYSKRRRALTGLLITLLIAPILALIIGGTSELVDFIKVTVDARNQQLPNFSVWGIPKVLFSNSGFARPELVSTPLRELVTVALAVWVIGLLVLVLHWSDSLVLGFWNATACVILLLPVSHFVYTMFWLPILWIWVGRWLAAPRFNDLVFFISAIMALWWLVTFNTGMDYGLSSPSLHFALTFFANLAAVGVSILGDHLFRIHSNGESQAGSRQATFISGGP
jgi:hypothetical protein